MNTYQGFKIIKNVLLTKAGEPYEVNRTWKERIFTLPWRPLQAKKLVTPQVPSDDILRHGNKLYMHPETADKLIKTFKN